MELWSIADSSGGIRASGTPGYDLSVDFVARTLDDIGFAVETTEAAFSTFREMPGTVLEIGDERFAGDDELRALIYSPSGDADGPITVLEESGCEADHFVGVPQGAIVFIVERGCLRLDQALNAQVAGAVAMLVTSGEQGPGEVLRPTLIDPAAIEIPVLSVTAEAAEVLRVSGGDEAHVVVDTEGEVTTLRSVVAQVGDGDRVVMLGGHLDSVLDGPGINDNGSGVAALLEVARGVAERGVPPGAAVRIGLWGGEEFGSVGSRAYAAGLQEDELVAYLNLDMAGSRNGATFIYSEAHAAAGSDRVTRAFEAWFAQHELPFDTIDLMGSSDHAGFVMAGIPTGGLFAGATEPLTDAQAEMFGGTSGVEADPCYHLECDDLDNVDLARVATFADATISVALRLAEAP